MAQSWIPIQWQALSGTQANFTFSSIPSGYRDLRIVVNASVTGAEGNIGIQLNGDTASNYSQVNMRNFGSGSAASSSGTGGAINSNYSTGLAVSDRATNTYDILDYAQTDKHKTILIRANHINEVDAIAGRWASTSAVTSVTISSGSTFAIGSTFALYGIAG